MADTPLAHILFISPLETYSNSPQPNTTILSVPLPSLRSAFTVPKSISLPLCPITVHGLLAADLALDTSTIRAPWRAVLPTFSDFQSSMPLLWPTSLQSLLPPTATTLLNNQKKKLAADWSTVSSAFPDLSYDNYVYAWLLVNTRTFYFLSASKKPGYTHPTNRDDCMALQPFADYFNHTSSSSPSGTSTECVVSFTATGYTFTTPSFCTIEKGTEIFITYGDHSNDFLLAEYGFILADGENEWDEISLDPYILPLFSASQKEKLDEMGFLGNYALDRREVCYRTQVSLRILFLPLKKWQRFANGADYGEQDQKDVDHLLLEVLKRYQNDATRTIKKIGGLKEGLPSQRDTLSKRWKQLHLLLQTAIDRIQS